MTQDCAAWCVGVRFVTSWRGDLYGGPCCWINLLARTMLTVTVDKSKEGVSDGPEHVDKESAGSG